MVDRTLTPGTDRNLSSNELYVVAYLEEDRTVAMVSLSGSKHRAAGWYLQIADGVQATRFFGPFDTPQKAFTAVPNTPETCGPLQRAINCKHENARIECTACGIDLTGRYSQKASEGQS